MRTLVATVVLVAVVILGIAAFALMNLRALIGAHRDRLVARVESVVGRPLTVGTIDPSWWPLGVRLRDVTVGEDAAFGSALPFLVADGVVMRVAPWPLVHGRIEVAGVALERPRIRLIRDEAGRWNVESLGQGPAAGGSGGNGRAKEGRPALRVPVEWVVGVALSQVRDGTITIDDRRAEWTTPLMLRRVRLHAENVRFGATAEVRLDAAIFAPDAPDVHLAVSTSELGQHDLEHAPFTARLTIDDADLGMLAAWSSRAPGTTGRVRRLTVDADGTLERTRATLAVQTVDPTLRIGVVPLGRMQPIVVDASVSRTRDAIRIDDLRATVDTLALQAHGDATPDPWRVSLAVTSNSGGAATVALGRTTIAVGALRGQLGIESEGVSFAPLALEVDAIPLELRGWITGADPPALDLHVEGRPFGGTGVADLVLDPAGSARVRIEASGMDLAPAVARFVPELAGAVTGTASGAAVLTGRFIDGALVAESLGGNGTLGVTDGRLRNVNLPDLVVEQIEQVPLMPTLVSAPTRARYAELFASRDTVVESASVPFTVARGRFTTTHAMLVNPAYQVTAEGWIDEARAVRLRGTVLLGAAVSRTLRDDVHAAKYLAEDDGRIALPFVARGRLGAMRVEPDGKRLRMRGLQALLGGSGEKPGAVPDDRERKDRKRDDDEDLEEKVIERLEKLLRP